MTSSEIVSSLSTNEAWLSAIVAIIAIGSYVIKPIRFSIKSLIGFLRSRIINPQSKKKLPSRRAYMDKLINLLEINKNRYRAVIVGPLFLHPDWVLKRRNASSSTRSYDDKLFRFILANTNERNHDIRLILANRKRYKTKVDKLVLEGEREKFIEDMLAAVDLVWGGEGEKGPDLLCSDVGHFRIDVIFDHAVVSAARLSPDRPLNGGVLSYSKTEIEFQTETFDQVFDELSEGNAVEVQKLREFIMNLWS